MTEEQARDRSDWLRERRLAAERGFDADYAPTYDRDDPPMGATHRRFVTDLVQQCPSGGRILDAAMCIDAMENVPPEHWPSVLAGLRRAVRPADRSTSPSS